MAEFQAMSNSELAERFRRGSERFERRLLTLNDDQLDTFFKPELGVGRWSCRVLVGHITDADLAFVHRMRRAVAEDHPVLAAWDEDAFIDAGLYGNDKGGKAYPVAGFIAVIHTLRMWHGEWLRTLVPQQWDRVALHPQRGEQSVRVILNYAAWHLEHHGWYLARKLEHLLGPRAE